MNFSKNLLFLTTILFIFTFSNVCAQEIDTRVVNKLNDPRVTVIVLQEYDGEIIHNEKIRVILNRKLLDMGFQPVIDVNHAISLNNAELLEHVYKGYPEEYLSQIDSVTDYLVIGRCSQGENVIFILDYYTGALIESPLKSVKTNLTVNVIVYDTGEIINSFSTEGIGFANSLSRASDQAINSAGTKAAENLEETFKNLSTRTTRQFLFKVYADDEENLSHIIDDLREVDTVNFVKLLEQHNTMAVLSVEAYQPPTYIVERLKEITKLKIYVNRLSGNSCELRVTGTEKGGNVDYEKNFEDTNNFEHGFDS